MALFEKGFEGLAEGGVGGVVIGAGVLLLAPTLLPVLGRALRPLAVSAIKTGMSVYNQAASTVREATQDLIAEARAELEAQEHGAGAPEARRRRGHAAEAAGS